MATNTAGSTARVYHQAQTHYLDAVITVANLSPTTTFKVGTLPAGAVILRCYSANSVVFNAGTNNFLSVGNAASGAQIAAAQAAGALGTNALTLVASAAQIMTADTDIYVTGAFTGTPATTGAGYIIIEYMAPDSILA